jgi:hypothetical protein
VNTLQPSESRVRKRHEYIRKSKNKFFWSVAERFYEREMSSVLKYITDTELPEPVRASLRKYLIISCVSLVEDFLSQLIVRVIEIHEMPIASIIDTPSESKAQGVKKFSRKIGKTVTKGEYVGSSSNFANPHMINILFTRLLNLDSDFSELNKDFFETVKKIDWYNPYKYEKGRRPLHKNWNRFMEMFELRNQIVHNMKEVELSQTMLSSNCENTMNFLEAAIFVADPTWRNEVINQLLSKKPLRR